MSINGRVLSWLAELPVLISAQKSVYIFYEYGSNLLIRPRLPFPDHFHEEYQFEASALLLDSCR